MNSNTILKMNLIYLLNILLNYFWLHIGFISCICKHMFVSRKLSEIDGQSNLSRKSNFCVMHTFFDKDLLFRNSLALKVI